MFELLHKNCGGVVKEDWSKIYEYEDDDGKKSKIPAFRCSKCRVEIVGDAQLEDFKDSDDWVIIPFAGKTNKVEGGDKSGVQRQISVHIPQQGIRGED